MKILIVIILLSALAQSQSQIPNPPVPMPGRIGPGGNYPLFNGGTIQISGNYTMTFPDMSASVIRFTGTLSATATITAPTSGTNPFGFEFTIQNATSGGHDIIIKGASGGGVTIPNGQAMMVIYDGANYVSVGAPSSGGGGPPTGAAGGDLSGTYPNPTVSRVRGSPIPVSGTGYLHWDGAAWSYGTPTGVGGITSINGSIVPAQSIVEGTGINISTNASTGVTTISNTFTPGGGGEGEGIGGTVDSITVRADDFGVKADGRFRGANVVGGSNTIRMFGWTGAEVHLTQGDVGKLILLYGVGPQIGHVAIWTDLGTTGTPITVQSGGSGGVDGWQPITWDDPGDGCNTIDTMPYAYVMVSGGVPTGNVVIPVFFGDGCTRVPHRGTVKTVNGVVAFTGGSLAYGDLPTVITSVIDDSHVTIADAPSQTQNGVPLVYGTNDHDAWEAACNDHYIGRIVFSGMTLTNRGINCGNARFSMEGAGYGPLGQGGSTFIYAGKGVVTPQNVHLGHDYIINLHAGWGAKLMRMGFRGNSMAKPYAVVASRAVPGCSQLSEMPCSHPLPGNGITQMNIYDELWFGAQWGDPPNTFGWGTTYQLQSCLFADANEKGFGGGNVDFATIDHTYCMGAEVGFDANHQQSTAYNFGKVHTQYDNIGMAVFGGQTWLDYYTEFNRLDIMMGSPIWNEGYSQGLNMIQYGGESSTKAFEYSKIQPHGGAATVTAWGLGLPFTPQGNNIYINPTGVWIDPTGVSASGHSFTWNGPIQNQGKLLWYDWCGNTGSNLDITGIRPDQIQWQEGYLSWSCRGGVNSWVHIHRFTQDEQVSVDAQLPGDKLLDTTLQNDQFFINTIGSILVRPPMPAYYYYDVWGEGASGSTTYRYELTCDDGEKLESAPSSVGTLVNRPSTLNTTNRNAISWRPRSGCIAYNLYGDSGNGEIGFLTRMSAIGLQKGYYQAQYPNAYVLDEGKWTKDTNRKPPVTAKSGAVDALNFMVNGHPFASTHLADFSPATPANGQVPIWNAAQGKYVPGNVSSGDGGGPGGELNIPQSEGVLYVTSGGGPLPPGEGVRIGADTILGNERDENPDYIVFMPFYVDAPSTVTDCNVYFGATVAGKAYCYIYDSDPQQFEAPGALLCNDTTGVTTLPNSWNKLTGLQVSGCPILAPVHRYYMAYAISGVSTMYYSSEPTSLSSYYLAHPCCTAMNPVVGATPFTNVYSMFLTVQQGASRTAVRGGPRSTYSLATTRGTGYLHFDGTNYSWDSGGPGGGAAVVTGTVTNVAPYTFDGGHLAKSGRLVNITGHINLQTSMPQNTPMAQIPVNFRPSTDPTNPNYFGGIFDSSGNFLGFGLWNVTSTGQITWRGSTVTPASGQIMVITAAWLQEE